MKKQDKLLKSIERRANGLMELIRANFPEVSRISLTVDTDGYMRIEGSRTKSDPFRFRQIMSACLREDEWVVDDPRIQNDYNRECGCLLEEDEDAEKMAS